MSTFLPREWNQVVACLFAVACFKRKKKSERLLNAVKACIELHAPSFIVHNLDAKVKAVTS